MASAALLMSLYRAQSSAKSRTAEPSILCLESDSWKVKIVTVLGNSPGAHWTGLELYWKLRPPVILAVSAPQGSPLSTREYCYGRHSNWSYIEGAYVVLYWTPSKSPGVLGLSGPRLSMFFARSCTVKMSWLARIFVCGSHVERHGVFLCTSRCRMMLLHTICSSMLHVTEVKLTGR